uniref:Uncharacterized protein n=1 Tax=Amphimedon queenslandica TaxID=400682 RepID=A0A1X7U3X8_AMPQE
MQNYAILLFFNVFPSPFLKRPLLHRADCMSMLVKSSQLLSPVIELCEFVS